MTRKTDPQTDPQKRDWRAHRATSVKTHAIPLRPEQKDVVELLAQDASDFIGRKIGGAAIVRALLDYAQQRGELWARTELFPLVEAELAAGVRWGKKAGE